MAIEQLNAKLPDYAKDIRLNLSSIMTEEGAPDLSQKQIYLVALAVAYALKHAQLIKEVRESSALTEAEINAAKAAATIMAMNNVYYRSVHLLGNKEFSSMPAKLRMNVIGNPGIDKIDFETMCLAVSAINGCGMCLEAHANTLIKAGMSKQGVQSAIRIAAVLNAVVTAIEIG